MSEVGRAYVSILPSARGFASRLQRELATDIARTAKDTGKKYGQGFEAAAAAEASGVGDKLRRDLAPDMGKAGKDSGQEFGQEFAKAAEDNATDSSVSEGIGSKLKLGLATAGAAAGVALMAGVNEAMERGALTDKLSVQLGGTAKQSQRYGKVAGDLYAGAWGESFADVNDAVSAVVSSVGGMRGASAKDLQTMTAHALDFASAFEVDVTRAAQVAGQMVRTGLATDATNAMDLLFASMQKVPANLREDVMDALDEYGPFMQDLGIVGEDAMALLVEGAEKGMYGVDKAGDAVKEFSIRATDMSEATKGAYQTLGIDAREATNDILAGGDDAAGAFDKIVNGLLNIKDPAERANTAIALFGTPLEDLSVTEIPAFLRSLTRTDDKLGKVAGAATRAGNKLNDNAATKFTEFKRTLETGFVNFIGEDVIPAAEDLWADIGPDVKRFGRAIANMGEDLGPVAKDVLPVFADALGGVATAVGRFATAFSKLPPAVQTALITGGLFALVRGRRGGTTGGGGMSPFFFPGFGGRTPRTAPDASRTPRTPVTTTPRRGGRFGNVANVATGAGLAAMFTGSGATPTSGATTGALFGSMGGPWGALAGATVGGATAEFSGLGTPDAAKPGDLASIYGTLMESDVGKYADELNINVKKLALGISRYGTSSQVFKDTMGKLKGVDQNIGSELAEFLTPGWQSKQTKAQRAMDDLAASTEGYGKSARTARNRTDDAADAGGDLAGLFRSALIPGADTLADKYDLGAREARHLRGAMLDATKGGKANEDQLRLVAQQLGFTGKETRQLLRDTGNLGDEQRDDAQASRNHKEALAGLADKLGLSDRQAKGLTARLLDTEDANRRAKGESQLHERQLRQVAQQMGLTRQQTQDLIDKYGKVPPKVETDAKFNRRDAENDVSSFVRSFNSMLGGIENEEVGINLTSAAKSAIGAVGAMFSGGLTLLNPKGKAKGGAITGPGTGKSDEIPTWLSNGEHVFTADDVRKAGGQDAMYAIRRMIQRGEFAKRGDLQYFRAGGAVDVNTNLREFGTARAMGSIEHLLAGIAAQAGSALSASLSERIATALATGGGRPLGPDGSLSLGQMAEGQAFARGEAGKPYQWGGTGNPSWDCSGFVGGAWAKALGRSPYVRQFTTASFGSGAGYGFRPGPGKFTVGNDPGSHMAGNIGGLGIESRGGDGVVLGSGITPLSSFDYMAHYDRGGQLRPGWTAAYNGTGRTETVRTADQERARNRPQRFVLDVGGGRVLTGFIDERINGQSSFQATTARMRR